MPKRRRGPVVVDPAKVAPVVKKFVKKCMTNTLEKKVFQAVNITAGATLTTAGAVVSADLIYGALQGVQDNYRTGNTINILKQVVRLQFTTSAANTNASQRVRVIFFRDHQTNGALPTVANILNSGAVSAGYTQDLVSKVGGKRFTILRDYTFAYNAQSVTGATIYPIWQRPFVFIFRKPSQVNFQGAAATIADVSRGSLFMLTISDVAVGQLEGYCQTQFLDG